MVRAVLLDALGTMVELEPPWPRLARALGGEVAEADVRAAFAAEMDYYRDHLHEGTDPESLAELRERCAAVLSAELRREVGAATMMAAIRFRAYPDAGPALAELRGRGVRLVCVSNWDCSLPDVLRRTALAERLDAVVVSALHGASKPDPGIFTAALELAGCRPDEALHVGDRDEDDAGARGAGIAPLRIDRSGGGEITSLAEIVEHLGR